MTATRKLLSAVTLFTLPILSFGQPELRNAQEFNGEAHIAFAKADVQDIAALKGALYIDDHYQHPDSVRAIVTPPQLSAFAALDLPYRILPHPNKDLKPAMIGVEEYNAGKSNSCDVFLQAYPTYGLYEQIMSDYAADYPEICRLEVLDTLPSGRRLLALVISDNVNLSEPEPRFLYTSTMHGDETAGYILMLRMIRDILCNYPGDEAIANLVDETEIWINPLANPDGTYAWGDNNLAGARRTNANFVDLNRNYLDPDDGANPDGNPYQPETIAFMNLADEFRFNLSSNLHGGVEVANYPWDTWQFLHADDDWWVHVCRQYADTAQANSPFGYFDYLDNGITNGYAWYSIAGGRQDYMTYFHRGRELTLELSNQKFIPASQFDSFWDYNRASLYNYLKQCLFGLRGVVTDALTGEPILANISIQGHDSENSDVFAELPFGDYYRYLHEGSYQVTFSAIGYIPQTLNATILNDQATLLDVALQPSNPCAVHGGTISTNDPLVDLCGGDGSPDLIHVDLEGASGFGSIFGVVDQDNQVMGSSQAGIFNVNGLPTGIYRIKHMSYGEGTNPAVSNASQLSGCYDLSNTIFFSVKRVDGGTISTNDPTTICGDDGIPSVLSFSLENEEGPNGKWAVLTNDLSEVLASANTPGFNFDAFGPGMYKVLHVSYGDDVNLGQVDPQDPEGCLNVSNKINVAVINCGSAIHDPTAEGNFSFTADRSGFHVFDLFDLSGRLIKRLYAGYASEGQRLSVPSSGESPGVYVLRLSSDGAMATKKVVLYGVR